MEWYPATIGGGRGGSHWSSCILLWMLARVCSQVRVAPKPKRLILGPGVSATVDLTSPLLNFTPGCAFSLPGNLTSFSWLLLKPVPVHACVCVFTHLPFHFEIHSRLFLTICLITSQSHRHPPLLPTDGPGASPPKQHPGDRCSHLGRLQVSAHWSSSWMGWGLGEGGTDVAMGVWSPRDQLCMRALRTCSRHTGVPAAAPSPLQLLPPQAPSPLQTLPLQLLSHPLSPPPPCSPPSCGFGWVTSS